MTWGVRWVLGRWSPAGLGPEEAALLGAVAVGDGGVVRLARVTLGVAVRLGPRDALLLAPPGVVVGGVADVVVDEGVGLLGVRVDLVLAVTSLGRQRIGTSVVLGGQLSTARAGGHRVQRCQPLCCPFPALSGGGSLTAKWALHPDALFLPLQSRDWAENLHQVSPVTHSHVPTPQWTPGSRDGPEPP